MSRYIDADALKNKITDIDCGCAVEGMGFDIYTCEVFELINEVPTADVVEKEKWDRLLENSIILADAVQKYQLVDMVKVVRCNDCVYYRCLTIMGSMPRMMCSVFNWQSEEDDFCSFAERIGDIT